MRNGLIAVRESTIEDMLKLFGFELGGGAELNEDERNAKVLIVMEENVGVGADAAMKFMRENAVERAAFYRKTGLVFERKVEQKVVVGRISQKRVGKPRGKRIPPKEVPAQPELPMGSEISKEV